MTEREDNFQRCMHCGDYADECQCDGGMPGGAVGPAMTSTGAPDLKALDIEGLRELCDVLDERKPLRRDIPLAEAVNDWYFAKQRAGHEALTALPALLTRIESDAAEIERLRFDNEEMRRQQTRLNVTLQACFGMEVGDVLHRAVTAEAEASRLREALTKAAADLDSIADSVRAIPRTTERADAIRQRAQAARAALQTEAPDHA